jgi:hypothetical protein
MEEDDNIALPRASGLRLPSSAALNKPKAQTNPQQELNTRVDGIESKARQSKIRASKLAVAFKKLLEDTTLSKHKTVLQQEMELQVISDMAALAQELDNDPDELEGIGTLSWVVQLLKLALKQRDRSNELEYRLEQIEKEMKK